FQTSTNTDITINFYTDSLNQVKHTETISLNAGNSTYGQAIYGTATYSQQDYDEVRFPLTFRFKTLKVELICNTPITDFKLLSLGFEIQKGDNK
ncbi:MAG: hypothetical protein ACKPB7_27625, partial [Sphaerospermopsis kisseleviana]